MLFGSYTPLQYGIACFRIRSAIVTIPLVK